MASTTASANRHPRESPLHLLGLDHERITFRHAGREFRLTDVAGRVVHDIIT